MVSSYLMFNPTQRKSQVFSVKEDGFTLRAQANNFVAASGPVSMNEEVVDEVWDRSAAVDKLLRYVTNLYLEPVKSALTNNVLNSKRTNWEKEVIYEIQGAKHASASESIPDSAAAALGMMKAESPNRAVVDLDEQGQVVVSGPIEKRRRSRL